MYSIHWIFFRGSSLFSSLTARLLWVLGDAEVQFNDRYQAAVDDSKEFLQTGSAEHFPCFQSYTASIA